MEERGVEELLTTIASDKAPGSPEAGLPGRANRTGDSIFSQILQRLLAGREVRLGEGAEGEDSLEILLENCADAIILLSAEGSVLEVNPAFSRAYGWSAPDLAGKSVLSIIPEAFIKDFRSKLARISPETVRTGEARIDDLQSFHAMTKDGDLLSTDCFLSPIRSGGELRLVVVLRDEPVGRELMHQLRESNDHFLALSETITEAIFRIDEDFNILFANSGVKNTFGFDRSEMSSRAFASLFPEEVFRRHAPEFRKYFYVDDPDRPALGLKRTIELLGITKNRGVAPMEMSFGNSREFKGRTLTCIVRDISQRKIMERRLRHLAFHDKLTGLGNRDLFNEDIRASLKEPGWERGRKAALLFLDLDGFKHVNDTLGHSSGDELLIETARRIRYCLRDFDSSYRFGGDEFVVFLPEIRESKDAMIVAERILRTVKQPFLLTSPTGGKAHVDLGVSVGVAVMPDHGSTAEEATKAADIAMYCSKETGKSRVTFYDERLGTKSTKRWRVEQEIRSALVKGEFEIHYQPIVTPERRLLGLEALARWRRADGSYTPPGEFIPVAEQSGTIVPLGEWIFRRAFADIKRLASTGRAGIYVSVNVSAMQFEQVDFAGVISDAIAKSGVPPSSIALELTETTLMSNANEAVSKVRAIKERVPELMIAIDDFGTGYSSLSYLSRLPVDVLKIDISFVRALAEEQDRKIVNSILTLAESLGIDVVAEGIETEEQLEYFRQRRIQGMQGYLFMKPAPIDDILRALDASRRRRAARP
jgi:diguanylate cyclase (GGDEF)-like protein/PAS domain S-box-containing protein